MLPLSRALLFLSLAGPILLLTDNSSPIVMVGFAILCCTAFVILDNSALRQLGSRCRPAIFGAAAAIALLVVQLLPWAPEIVTYPIWKTASDALGANLGNRISLDPSDTIGALLPLLFLTSAMTATAAVCSEPRTAPVVHRLISLAICLTSAFTMFIGWTKPDHSAPGLLSALTVAALITAVSLLFDRKGRKIEFKSYHDLLLITSGFLLGVGAMFDLRSAGSVIAAVGGALLTALLAWLPVAKLPRRAPVLAAMASTVLIIGIALMFPRLLTDPPSLSGNVDATAAIGRMIADAPLLGTGGGTFSTLAQIYAHDSSQLLRPPSLAAKLYVEYGPIGTSIIVLAWLTVCFELVAGALRRMRDRYLCASAAALSLATAASAFLDTSATEAPIQLIVAMLIGLGLAQRESSVR